MKEIKRDIYLNRLIRRRENGFIKVITGIRRSGKSYLLDPIFRNYLCITVWAHKMCGILKKYSI